MIPLVSSAVMRECDAREVERRGVASLVKEAGTRVALEAHRMLGSLFARRICVLVGPGLNGADGLVAATILRARGCRVEVIEVARQPEELRGFDLVIDAAFGLGCTRSYEAPRVDEGTRVLAVDLPSGVDADAGTLLGRPLRANVTLALGALKFAHLDGEAASYCGELRFASLGITAPPDNALVEDDDLATFLVAHREDHKWDHAVSILAGSARMPGAAALVCAGALSAGASMVRLESKGEIASLIALPAEIVRVRGPALDPRSRCVVAGPGLGKGAAPWLLERLNGTSLTTVLDADALRREVVSLPRRAARILTPHAGEFERLVGTAVGAQRIPAVRSFAAATDCVVLLKGPLTVIADPQGRIRIVNSGTSALATAGTGDVLSGMIGAAVARGHAPLDAASLSAHLHGRAGSRIGVYQTAGALPAAVRRILNERFH